MVSFLRACIHYTISLNLETQIDMIITPTRSLFLPTIKNGRKAHLPVYKAYALCFFGYEFDEGLGSVPPGSGIGTSVNLARVELVFHALKSPDEILATATDTFTCYPT
jgi:hypothetical protein